jgi:hypothetical protein
MGQHVVRKDSSGALVASRPHYEPTLLTTLNERLKSGDVTVSHSRRWSDFEEYLIPRPRWINERAQHYAALELPLDADGYLSQLNEGHVIDDDILGLTTPLFRKHVNPFGKYHFDLGRMRQAEGGPKQGIA